MIHKTTGYKVHVNNLIYKIYDKLPAVQAALTVDPYETPVHCCIYENRKRDLSKSDLMKSSLCNNAKTSGVRSDFGINTHSKCEVNNSN